MTPNDLGKKGFLWLTLADLHPSLCGDQERKTCRSRARNHEVMLQMGLLFVACLAHFLIQSRTSSPVSGTTHRGLGLSLHQSIIKTCTQACLIEGISHFRFPLLRQYQFVLSEPKLTSTMIYGIPVSSKYCAHLCHK